MDDPKTRQRIEELNRQLQRAMEQLNQAATLLGDVQARLETFSQPEKETLQAKASPKPKAPKAKAPKPSKDGNFELRFGMKGLSIIGIVVLLMGLAMALSYSFAYFSNEMKIIAGFLLAGGFFAVGHRLHRRFAILGRLLQGGGLSLGYLSTFAAFFIPEVRLFEGGPVGVGCLFVYVAFMLSVALKLKSQAASVLALAFGYYTAGYSGSQSITLLSAGGLSIAYLLMSYYHPDWKVLKRLVVFGVALVYLSTLDKPHNTLFMPTESAQQLFLAFHFVLFHLSALMPEKEGDVTLYGSNTLVMYALFATTHSGVLEDGVLETLLAATHIVTLLVAGRIRNALSQTLAQAAFLLTMLFAALATVSLLDGPMLPAALTTEAVCLGFLYRKDQWPALSATGSVLFLVTAYLAFLATWLFEGNTASEIIATAAFMYAAACLLEHALFKVRHVALSSLMLIPASLIFYFVLMDEAPDEWRTLSVVATGFALLATGFVLGLKKFRLAGLLWIFIGGGLSLLPDLAGLAIEYKIILFILSGLGLIGGSYAYHLFEKRLAAPGVASNHKDGENA